MASTVHIHYARPNGEIFLAGSGATLEEAEKAAFVEARRRLMETDVATATPSTAMVCTDGQKDAEIREGDFIYISPLKSVDVESLRNMSVVCLEGADAGKAIVKALTAASPAKFDWETSFLLHLSNIDSAVRPLRTKCHSAAQEQCMVAFKYCTFDVADGANLFYDTIRKDPVMANKCCIVRIVGSALDVTGSCLLNTSSVVFAKGLDHEELESAFDQFSLRFLFRSLDRFELAYKECATNNRCLVAVCERGVPIRAHSFEF